MVFNPFLTDSLIWLLWTFTRMRKRHHIEIIFFQYFTQITEREREIKFIGLFENRGHRGPYSPYKPFNHNLYIGIIIFPHISNHWGAQHNFSLCLCQPCSYGCSSADGTGASIIACLMDVMVVVWCILGVFRDRPWGWQSDRDRPLRSWWQHSSGAGWPRWGCWCWWRMEDGDVVQWWWWWGWRCARKT